MYSQTTRPSGKYFKKRLALANGLVTGGSGVGTIAMGPFYHFVISTLGWRMLLRILSCIALLIFVAALTYRPVRARKSGPGSERSTMFDCAVWTNKAFIFWVFSTSFLFVGYFVPFIHLVSLDELTAFHFYQLTLSGHFFVCNYSCILTLTISMPT